MSSVDMILESQVLAQGVQTYFGELSITLLVPVLIFNKFLTFTKESVTFHLLNGEYSASLAEHVQFRGEM